MGQFKSKLNSDKKLMIQKRAIQVWRVSWDDHENESTNSCFRDSQTTSAR